MRDGTETRSRLKREALRLFVARGIDRVSVRDLAAAAGCTPSSLYTHWPSLDALIAELFAEGYAAYGHALAEAAADRPGPFPRRLEAMLRRICRLHAADPTRFAFLLLTQHRGASGLEGFAAAEANPVALVQREVEAAMAGGELPPGDPALLTAAVVGIVVQAATFHHYGRIARGLAAMEDEIVALCLRLVAAPAEGCRR